MQKEADYIVLYMQPEGFSSVTYKASSEEDANEQFEKEFENKNGMLVAIINVPEGTECNIYSFWSDNLCKVH